MRSGKFVLALASLSLLLAGCGSQGPEDVASALLTATVQGDVDTIVRHMSSEFSRRGEGEARRFAQMLISEELSEGDDLRYEILDVSQTGDIATVRFVSFVDGEKGEPEEFPLVNEDGEWKLAAPPMF